MSEHNPFDDEEAFSEQIIENSIPQEEDTTKTVTDREVLLNDVIGQIRHHFNRSQLVEVTLAFEYADVEGFTSWVTTHYIRKN